MGMPEMPKMNVALEELDFFRGFTLDVGHALLVLALYRLRHVAQQVDS
jgi:hypothetical protein